jgi:uncharacterized secreted protein with C-terminal beta-propeller domain
MKLNLNTRIFSHNNGGPKMKGWIMPVTVALTLCASLTAVWYGTELFGILIAMLLPSITWYGIEGRKTCGKWFTGAVVVASIVVILVASFSVYDPANYSYTELTAEYSANSHGWDLLEKFSSHEELNSFIIDDFSSVGQIEGITWGVSGSPPISLPALPRLRVPAPSAPMPPRPAFESRNFFGILSDRSHLPVSKTSFKFRITEDSHIRTDYSTTNIQVEGVDEADIVKTDGKYLYVVSRNVVTIILAYPAEDARVISKIELDETPLEIFVTGDRLVILGSHEWVEPTLITGWIELLGLSHYYESPVPWSEPRTTVRIYDISNRQYPVLMEKIETSGSYFNSRMIGRYVYVVVNMQISFDDNNVILPMISSPSSSRRVPATEIYYFENLPKPNVFAILIAIDAQTAEKLDEKIVLTNRADDMYVSTNNIYITYADWRGRTIIHKISLRNGKIRYEGQGEVPGHVLNQFSMDEYEGYFRIATTTGWYGANHLYILDKDMNIVGRLENLAPGERIYSARFMGERAYLVTFKKVDPLFVIDLEDPYNPRVLGKLKIPGYSDYLHPYDETHLIGIGKDTIDAGDFAWFQGVKIALFDVSDPENPKEISKIVIGERGTESYVLRDHRAFLFSRCSCFPHLSKRWYRSEGNCRPW